MKFFIFIFFVSVSTVFSVTREELLLQAKHARVPLHISASLRNSFDDTSTKNTKSFNHFIDEPLQDFIQTCNAHDIAVIWNAEKKSYTAVPRDEQFITEWESSCEALHRAFSSPVTPPSDSIATCSLKSGNAFLSRPTRAVPEEKWHLVTFTTPPSDKNYIISDYVGNNTWLVKPKNNAWDEDAIAVSLYNSNYKVSPRLFEPESYFVGDSPDVRVLNIHMFSNKSSADARNAIIRNNGRVLSEMRAIGCIVARVPVKDIPALCASEHIKWIEKAGPPLSVCNDEARTAVTADAAQSYPYNYSGTNVDVLVYDGGLTDQHVDYADRLTTIETGGTHYHATHVAGTILGNGSASSGQYRGMAPEARLLSGEYDGNGGDLFYNNPADIESDYSTAINSYGADIANNSIGMNIQMNGYPDSYYGDYETCSILVDAIATGALGRAFLSVWAAGNERSYTSDDYSNISPPQCAKNSLVVGATYSDDNTITSFSSFGPLDDGRLKPDVCAPGSEHGAGIYSTYEINSYQDLSGTSMASPVTTGCATLLIECWREYNSGANPLPAVVKAILINTARDLTSPGPSYDYGYGLVQIVPALDAVRNDTVIQSDVSDGDTMSYSMSVSPTADNVRVSLAWTDPPASPLADPVLVNDLDLQLIDPYGTVYYPWTLDPDNPSLPAVNTRADRLNNTEQVSTTNVIAGIWTIRVSGYNVPVGGAQEFALCANTTVSKASSTGRIFMNKSKYTAPSDITLELRDTDLSNETEYTVLVTSDTEPTGENVTLTTTLAGMFEGTLGLTPVAPVADNMLSVSHGDTVTAYYIDADDGQGNYSVTNTATAAIDLLPPVIFNVQADNITDTGATITWDTDEDARGKVVILSPSTTYFEENYYTTHSMNLTNLTPGTRYLYYIIEEDVFGHVSTNDNSGLNFSFSTRFFQTEWNEDAETLPAEWESTSGWHRSQLRPLNGQWSWYCGDEATQLYPDDYEAILETPLLTIAESSALLRFKEYIDTESGWDFCHIEISTNDVDWLPLRDEVSGYYPTRDVSLSLNDFLPASIRIRFRFLSDYMIDGEGWYLDDVSIGKFAEKDLIATDTLISDPLPNGDNDGYPEPGETIHCNIILYNGLDSTVTNITSTLVSSSPYVTITQSNASHGTIASMERSTNALAYTFTLAPGTPVPVSLPFTLISTDNSGHIWHNNVNIMAQFIGYIDGYVRQLDSLDPVTNATVYCSGASMHTAHTDSGGHFTLPELYAHTYSIYAHAPGFVDTTPIDVTLPPDATNVTLYMGYAELVHSPGEFNITLRQDDIVTDNLNISNAGNAELEFALIPQLLSTLDTGHDNIDRYQWVDEEEPSCPPFDWIDISSDGQVITLGDDDVSDALTMNHSFPWYDGDYSQLWIHSNGGIALEYSEDEANFSNAEFPSDTAPDTFLAMLWDDLNPFAGGDVYFKSTANYTVVSFIDVPPYAGDTGEEYSFQIILYSNGSVKMQYLSLNAPIDDCTVGWQAKTRTRYANISYNTTYLHDNAVIYINQPAKWYSLAYNFGVVTPAFSTNVPLTFSAVNMDTGLYHDVITIDSNGGISDLPITLNITASNAYPVVMSPAHLSEFFIQIDSNMVMTIDAYDPEGGQLTFTMTNAPASAILHSNAFSYTPAGWENDITYTTTFLVTDNDIEPATQSIDVYIHVIPEATLGAIITALCTAWILKRR